MGDGGACIVTEEHRRKQSESIKKFWESFDSTERDAKISATLKGRVIGCNKKKSEAAKRRKRQALVRARKDLS